MKRWIACASTPAPTAALAAVAATRAVQTKNWMWQNSTRDQRTREQREADRKTRQLEKLPKPQALHDFDYPTDKVVLCDQDFQDPVYSSELDTPELFNLFPPTDFFVPFSVRDFERTAYPQVPEHDHRLDAPGSDAFRAHARRALKFAWKHQIAPTFVPHRLARANMSVVFGNGVRRLAHASASGGSSGANAALSPAAALAAASRRADQPAATALTRDNFWLTAHCGNYIELCELQRPPSLFIADDRTDGGGSSRAEPEARYTLLVASPDYPTRTQPNRGFYLQYCVANLRACGAGKPAEGGVVVVPYTPPLPTEDAGTARTLCMLFRQTADATSVLPASLPAVGAPAAFASPRDCGGVPFALRTDYRLHSGCVSPSAVAGRSAAASALGALEAVLSPIPDAVTFFQTAWDIQVQEFYAAAGQPEPQYTPPDVLDALALNARPIDAERALQRELADGSLNDGNQLDQKHKFRSGETSMNHAGLSQRTMLSKDKKPVVRVYGKL